MDDVDKLVTGSQQIGEQLPSAGGEAAPQSRHAGPSVNEDQHYLQSDDYFISEQPLQGNEWIYVKLAKMTTKPTAASKGEAEFFKVGDGNKLPEDTLRGATSFFRDTALPVVVMCSAGILLSSKPAGTSSLAQTSLVLPAATPSAASPFM